ncbi:thioredoxin family protein (plasmid) [Haladaptatus sp. SPP-AMP-3]|uniref:thioredoxin family protein n=1 Tax=Haladaptatus sp. SPP-AMP-3 TaxID=3121295 RepID=UPI003C2C5DF3
MESTVPNPEWDASEHSETINAFESGLGELTYRVWGADWCGDCRSRLPDFFAALDAAGVEDERIHVYEVDDEKIGELTEEYDVTLIPTIVVERAGEEIARFEEQEERPAAEYVAHELFESDALA